tara:strand:+ start:124 stop:345 length:222 start_codon:yes stop_codon:yes gene_type:complete
MSDGFYDDWIASDDTSDHYDPIQAYLEGQLEELERDRERLASLKAQAKELERKVREQPFTAVYVFDLNEPDDE